MLGDVTSKDFKIGTIVVLIFPICLRVVRDLEGVRDSHDLADPPERTVKKIGTHCQTKHLSEFRIYIPNAN